MAGRLTSSATPIDSLAAARRAGMDLLARRDHSEAELAAKLRRRGASPDLISDALSGLRTDGLLDDTRFAESFVRSRAGRGKGPRLVRAELMARGVGDTVINTVLAASDTDWSAVARRVRGRRFGEAPPADISERARQTRFLERRGFTGGQTRAAFEPADD